MTEQPRAVTSVTPLDHNALYWVIAAVVLATLPHLGHLPWWLCASFAVSVGWRCGAAHLEFPLPTRWFLIAVTIAATAITVLAYRTLIGRDAGVALLIVMTSLKLLEAHTVRDGAALLLMGYFVAMANLLYSQSLLLSGYLLLVIGILLVAQMRVVATATLVPLAIVLGLVGRMLLKAIPIMLLLFVFFPRVSGPFWGVPIAGTEAITGLSDEMAPGRISKLSQSDAVAFRVRFSDDTPAATELYWRGPVLSHYERGVWKAAEPAGRTLTKRLPEGKPVDYSVTIEPHGKRWLFALDVPASAPEGAAMTASMEVLSRRPVDNVMRYDMRSYRNYRSSTLSTAERRLALQLPANENPRTHAVAERWRRQLNPQARIDAALSLYRVGGFRYTLQPPLLGQDEIDDFLFNTRRGYCEHFASSFVFMMRASGVPARVVTGYQGGERNHLGDYLMVRQSDAHAWAEVWLSGRGWVRIDPTAAVAPRRVEEGVYSALENPAVLPFLAQRDDSALRRLALAWDGINSGWNDWVLTYGAKRQRQVLSAGLSWVSGHVGTAALAIGILAGAAMTALGFALWRRRIAIDPESKAFELLCAKLARVGLIRNPNEGAIAFAERVAEERPDLANRVRLISGYYARLRYGRGCGPDMLRQLVRLAREFKA